MKVSQFIQNVQNILKEYPLEQLEMGSIYDLESQMALLKLGDIINRIPESPAVLNTKNMKEILNFFKDRWKNDIMGTDAIECYRPTTPANQVCRKIMASLRIDFKRNAAKHLMPTLKEATFSRGKGVRDIFLFSPGTYVLSDNNDYVIHVQACLRAFSEKQVSGFKNPQLCHTAKNQNGVLLSETEAARVINHTEATKAFYEAITSEKELTKSERSQLVTKLMNDNADPIPAYGEAGEALMKERIYRNIHSLKDLAGKLVNLPPHLWKPYCQFIDKERFNQIILSDSKKIQEVLDSKGLFGSDEYMNRAVYFSLLEYYVKNRKEGSYYGSWSAMLFRGYSAGDKIPAAEEVQALLYSEQSLPEIAAELNSRQGKLGKHRGALNDGNLSSYTALLRQLAGDQEAPEVTAHTITEEPQLSVAPAPGQ